MFTKTDVRFKGPGILSKGLISSLIGANATRQYFLKTVDCVKFQHFEKIDFFALALTFLRTFVIMRLRDIMNTIIIGKMHSLWG